MLNSTTLSNPTKSTGFSVTNFPSDQGLIGEAMNGASGGSANNRRSDRWCERWIRGLKNERRIAIDGATDGASDGSVIEGAMVAVSD